MYVFTRDRRERFFDHVLPVFLDIALEQDDTLLQIAEVANQDVEMRVRTRSDGLYRILTTSWTHAFRTTFPLIRYTS